MLLEDNFFINYAECLGAAHLYSPAVNLNSSFVVSEARLAYSD